MEEEVDVEFRRRLDARGRRQSERMSRRVVILQKERRAKNKVCKEQSRRTEVTYIRAMGGPRLDPFSGSRASVDRNLVSEETKVVTLPRNLVSDEKKQ